jgi:hypothetical protein
MKKDEYCKPFQSEKSRLNLSDASWNDHYGWREEWMRSHWDERVAQSYNYKDVQPHSTFDCVRKLTAISVILNVFNEYYYQSSLSQVPKI